jgi:hypothetical protein
MIRNAEEFMEEIEEKIFNSENPHNERFFPMGVSRNINDRG